MKKYFDEYCRALGYAMLWWLIIEGVEKLWLKLTTKTGHNQGEEEA